LDAVHAQSQNGLLEHLADEEVAANGLELPVLNPLLGIRAPFAEDVTFR